MVEVTPFFCRGNGPFLIRMAFSLILGGRKMLGPDLKECIASSVMSWILLLCLVYVRKIYIFFKLKQLLVCFIKAGGKSDNSVSGIEWKYSN